MCGWQEKHGAAVFSWRIFTWNTQEWHFFGAGESQSSHLCAPLRPLLWQESARLYWIITPHWLRVVRAPASLIWQHRWPRPPRALNLRQKRRQREPRCVSLLFLMFTLLFSLLLLRSVYQNVCPHIGMNYSSPPPTPHLQALILAFVWRRCQCAPGGSRFTASAGRCCHTCVILPPPRNNSAFIVHPQYSSCSFTDLVSSFFLQKLSHITAAPFPIQRDLNCFVLFFTTSISLVTQSLTSNSILNIIFLNIS